MTNWLKLWIQIKFTESLYKHNCWISTHDKDSLYIGHLSRERGQAVKKKSRVDCCGSVVKVVVVPCLVGFVWDGITK